MKLKAEDNNDKRNTQNRIKMEVVNEINQMGQVLHKHRTIKESYIAVV